MHMINIITIEATNEFGFLLHYTLPTVSSNQQWQVDYQASNDG